MAAAVDHETARIFDSLAEDGTDEATERQIRLTPASQIRPRPVHWLWDLRMALGTICLLAGREGIGKSTIAYALAALITRGKLEGVHFGEPRAVIVAATEDSWQHTIVPRLMAADADLDLVFRVDVTVFGASRPTSTSSRWL
jgi:MoxR-like ATPase